MDNKSEVCVKEVRIPNGNNIIYGKVFYDGGKKKQPLMIMSHGYNGSYKDFEVDCEFYAENGFAAFCYDFCGGSVHAVSTGNTLDMTIFTEKSDLLTIYAYFALKEWVDTEKIYLFGGSQGGLVTTLATEELKDKVAGMILYFPALCIADNWRKTYPELPMIPDETELWGMKLGRVFFETIHDFQVRDEIGKYPGKVLILHGTEDAIVPLSYSEEAVTLYQDAKLIVMEKEGHGFSKEGSLIAREHVLTFLKQLQ